MPWIESCCVDQRVKFIADWASGRWTLTELSMRHRVSRKTLYKWLSRYAAEGPAGLEDRSRAPLAHGRGTPVELAEAIIQLREKEPYWGPLKIVGKLAEVRPDLAWPSPSTAGEILKRAGMVSSRRRRSRTPPTLGGLTLAERPNHLWAADHTRAWCAWAMASAASL